MSIDGEHLETNARKHLREQRARFQEAKNTYYTGRYKDKRLPPDLMDPGSIDAEIRYLDGKVDESLSRTRATEKATDDKDRQRKILGGDI